MKLLKKCFAVLMSSALLFFGLPETDIAKAATASKTKINPGDRIIVSIGDSYSSGEGVEDFYGWKYIESTIMNNPNITVDKLVNDDFYDWLAHRSEKAWSGQLTLPGVGQMSEHRNKNWYFAASSGAVLWHLDHEQEKDFCFSKRFDIRKKTSHELKDSIKLEPQLDIFDKIEQKENIAYVTMTLSGNDMNFVKIVSEAVRIQDVNKFTSSLQASWDHFYEKGGVKDQLYEAYKKIQEKAGPQAKIVVAGYPKLLDPNGSIGFTKDNSRIIYDSVVRYNGCLEYIVNDCRINQNLNTYFVSVDGDEYFGGHEATSELFADSYMNYIILFMKDQDLIEKDNPPVSAYSMHPNEKGIEVYRRAVQDKIDELEKIKTPAETKAPEMEMGGVRGYVLDENGAKISAADISMEDVVNDKKYTTQTYKSGNFEINIPDGAYSLNISAEGYNDYTHSDYIIVKNSEMTNLGEIVLTRDAPAEEPEEVTQEVPQEGEVNTDNEEFFEFIEDDYYDYDYGVPLEDMIAWEYYNGHLYALYDYSLSAHAMSLITAANPSIHLVTITDADEQAAVEDLIAAGGRPIYYTGGMVDSKGRLYWISDEKANYSNWYPGCPEDYNDPDYDDIVVLYRGFEPDARDDPDFGAWFEILENEWSYLDIFDSSFDGITCGIIIEWDDPENYGF